MTRYVWSDFTAEAEDMNQPGSTLPTRPSEGWSGSRANNCLRATNSALHNLGAEAALRPLDGDGNPDSGPNAGRVGTMAWQNADAVDLTGGLLGPGVRGSLPISGVISWYGSFEQLAAAYEDLRLRGFDICDGRTTVNPYPPFNVVVMPDFRGRYIYYFDTVDTLAQNAFTHTKLTDPAGSHGHGGRTAGAALTSAQVPPLARTTTLVESGTETTVTASYSYGGPGSAHDHGISTEAAHQHTVDVRPASVVCVPLMRVW